MQNENMSTEATHKECQGSNNIDVMIEEFNREFSQH